MYCSCGNPVILTFYLQKQSYCTKSEVHTLTDAEVRQDFVISVGNNK